MALPPFDGTGWITGMPGLPGAPVVIPATGANAGLPGAWTPAGATAPASLAVLTPAIVANPATAWTVGTHVITADAAHVHWDGTAWAAGDGAALDEDTLSGWTKAELTAFAADHEPPIEVPSGATKAQIIALILAAIQADPNEEN